MAVNVNLPSLGVAILEAKIMNWLKEEGEPVEKNEEIVEVETDKTVFEVVAPVAGVLLKRLYEVGETVKVDEPLAVVGQSDEEINDVKEDEPREITDEVKKIEKEATNNENELHQNSGNIRLRMTPKAKKMVEVKGISLDRLEGISGSGIGGMITSEDILKIQPDEKEIIEGDNRIIPFTGMRKRIADNLSRSKNEAVQVTTVVEVDMTETNNLRKMLKSPFNEKKGVKLTYLPFVIKASLEGIKEFPIINSSLQDEGIVIKKNVNFGIAVQTADGLLVPVLHSSEQYNFQQLAEEIDRLVKTTKEQGLITQYTGGGSITISNAGSYGSILSTPIIYPGQSAILWMGKIIDRPVARGEEVVIRKMMNLCISYDHRIIDGAEIAQFLEKVRVKLENPGEIILD